MVAHAGRGDGGARGAGGGCGWPEKWPKNTLEGPAENAQ